ncbi:DUF6233 domain-containing protein [Streptomyces sp. NBC_00258]|nr:DUF6233 domain-containing protein [Streptomyces sp. NBC_00258]
MVKVHRGDCWAAAKSGRCHPASKEQVVEALQSHVEPCGFRRSDTELGF